MAIVNLLHISDMHFGLEPIKEKITTSAIQKRELVLGKMLRKLSEIKMEWKPNIIAISGDIGWKSVEDDYQQATKWMEQLRVTLSLSKSDIIICPGNHDINREKAKKYIRFNDSKTADEILSIADIEDYSSPFENYVNFCENYKISKLNNSLYKSGNSKLSHYLYGYRELQGLCFLVLNSAWCCRGDDDSGKLWLGYPNINDIQSLIGYNYEEIVISLFHHPKEFFHYNDKHENESRMTSYDKIVSMSDMILNGHIHAGIKEATRAKNKAYVFTAGSTYEPNNYRNSFQIIQIDTHEYTYSTKGYEFDIRKEEWKEEIIETNIKFRNKGCSSLIPKTDPFNKGTYP